MECDVATPRKALQEQCVVSSARHGPPRGEEYVGEEDKIRANGSLTHRKTVTVLMLMTVTLFRLAGTRQQCEEKEPSAPAIPSCMPRRPRGGP